LVWFEKSERLLKAFRSQGTQKMSKANLQQLIQSALESASVTKDRTLFDQAAKTEFQTVTELWKLDEES
jgi:hypothetical protein